MELVGDILGLSAAKRHSGCTTMVLERTFLGRNVRMAHKTTIAKVDKVPIVKIINGNRTRSYKTKKIVFSQGDPSDAVFYIQKGKVKLTVLSRRGKEAIVAILHDSTFFGEQCLAMEPVRVMTATAAEDCSLVRIERGKMLRILHKDSELSMNFISCLLSRNRYLHENLVDHFFNHSEKRLARLLLSLAHFGKDRRTADIVPTMNQESLAEMVGTTRGRISFFMTRFRKQGFIAYASDYNGIVRVHRSLLDVLLQD
jgi:CRP/FNR family cyclic AMP-dependent transcriptional regulator